MNVNNSVPPRLEHDLRALCQLSGVIEPVDFGYLSSFVQEAPDPETAVRQVLEKVPSCSEVLTRKWRNVITDMWALHHPHVPLLPDLKLSATEVAEAPLLLDTRAVLAALEERPAHLVQAKHEWLVEPSDVQRLIQVMPSQRGKLVVPVENEWNFMSFRRLRALLHAARLIRPWRGVLVPTRSRVDLFLGLPAPQQLYILWHADVYHVDWGEFAGLWGAYMHVVQEYLPLLWDTIGTPHPGQVADRGAWALNVMEAFAPAWSEVGLLDIRASHTTALHIVQQHALPTIIDRFLLRDLLEHHGLVTITEEFGHLSEFTWTKVGVQLMPAEARRSLPCGNELLDL